MADTAGHATVTLGAMKDVARRLVDEGRYESISEVCRAGLRKIEHEERLVDRLVKLGEAGMASGIAEDFDIDAFIEETDTLDL